MTCINSCERAPVPIMPTAILPLGEPFAIWAAPVRAAPEWINRRRVMDIIIVGAGAGGVVALGSDDLEAGALGSLFKLSITRCDWELARQSQTQVACVIDRKIVSQGQ